MIHCGASRKMDGGNVAKMAVALDETARSSET